jgi:hypothetical protein
MDFREVEAMEDARESVRQVASDVCEAVRYLGDMSYAMMPRDMAHAVGDLKKAFLRNVRSLIDWEMTWVEERVAGGDRLREEWKAACCSDAKGDATEPVN